MQNWDSLCKKLETETELMGCGIVPEAVMCPASSNGVLILKSKQETKCLQCLQNSLHGLEKSWREEIHSDKCCTELLLVPGTG